MSKKEEWAAVGGVWLLASIIFGFMWIADIGPFEDTPEKPKRGPEILVTNFGGGSWGCVSEQAALRLADAFDRQDRDKVNLLMKSQCEALDGNVRVKFVSGSFSRDTRQIVYRGKVFWVHKDSVEYLTQEEIALTQSYIDCVEGADTGAECTPQYRAMRNAGL